MFCLRTPVLNSLSLEWLRVLRKWFLGFREEDGQVEQVDFVVELLALFP